MAIQTLLPYDINERNAARQGAAALNEQLDRIIQNRVQQMNKDQQRKDLKAAGYSDTDIGIIQQIPQNDLFKFLTSFRPEQAQQPQSMQNTFAQGLQGQQPQLPETLGALAGQPQDMIQRALGKTPLQQFTDPQSMQAAPQAQTSTAQPQTTAQRLASTNFESPEMRLRREIHAENLALKREINAEKLTSQKEERFEKREDKLRNDLNDISKHAQRAKQDINALHQIKVANDSGKLIQGQKRKLLEQFGLEDYFTNTSTQYVAKNIERMITGATEAFGTGRLTNFLAETYSKALPRLVNTKEGMNLLIKNLILEKQADIALNDEIRKMKSEARESGKILPSDIEDKARDRIQPKLESYQRESLANIEKALGTGSQQSFEALPRAADYAGKTITDTKTGTKYRSNGSKWVKV